MEKPHKLKNPPIAEVVMDIRVGLETDPNFGALESIYDEIKTIFPTKEISNKWEGFIQIKPGEDPVARSSGGQNGFIYKNSDNTKIFQARVDGFTFNQLRSYQGGEHFIDEGLSLWQLYAAKTKPVSINRLALRYINFIEVPIAADLQKFVSYIPQTGEVYKLQDFLIRLSLSDVKKGSQANVILGVDHLKNTEETKTVIFDIDVYKLVSHLNLKEMKQIFDELREYKNKLFFDGVTEDTLKFYE